MENIETFIPILLGIFICLFGYRLKKAVFFIAWFLIGFTITNKLMPTLMSSFPDLFATDFWRFLMPVVGGLLLALLGFSIEKICVALLALFTVIMLGINYYGFDFQVIAIAAVIGVIAAGFSTMLIKPSVILITAIIGASAISTEIFKILPTLSAEDYKLAFFAGSAVIGTVVQFFTTKHIE